MLDDRNYNWSRLYEYLVLGEFLERFLLVRKNLFQFNI